MIIFFQNGGACHDAEIHMVHVREGTDDDLLVVGILLDASMYGYNNEVRFASLSAGLSASTTVALALVFIQALR